MFGSTRIQSFRPIYGSRSIVDSREDNLFKVVLVVAEPNSGAHSSMATVWRTPVCLHQVDLLVVIAISYSMASDTTVPEPKWPCALTMNPVEVVTSDSKVARKVRASSPMSPMTYVTRQGDPRPWCHSSRNPDVISMCGAACAVHTMMVPPDRCLRVGWKTVCRVACLSGGATNIWMLLANPMDVFARSVAAIALWYFMLCNLSADSTCRCPNPHGLSGPHWPGIP